MRYGSESKLIEFLDPKNMGLDTKITVIAQLIVELWPILGYGGHLGCHLEFQSCAHEPECPPKFLSAPRGVLLGSRVQLRGHMIAHRTYPSSRIKGDTKQCSPHTTSSEGKKLTTYQWGSQRSYKTRLPSYCSVPTARHNICTLTVTQSNIGTLQLDSDLTINLAWKYPCWRNIQWHCSSQITI